MPNLETLINTKVTGLGEITAYKGELASLGAQTEAVSTSSTKLGGSTASLASTQVAGRAAATGLTAETAALGSQAEKAAASSGQLGTVTASLAGSTLAQKEAVVASAGATAGLAVAQGEAAASTAASNSVMSESATVLTSLANVDGALIGQKRSMVKATEEEAAAHAVTAEQIKRTAAATGEFGAAGVAATEKLSGLGAILGPAGGVSVGLAGAVIGLGATVAIAKGGIDTFTSLGESVLKYQRVTGASADESSRMVDVFGQLGVGGDRAASAMFMLDKRIEGLDGATTKTAKTLDQIGIEIAKNADGSTNLEKTLFNVADAYNASDSAAQRDTIATTAFGKQAKDLLPILEQGSAGLQQMASQAQLLFNQQQLEQAHQYGVEQSKLGQEASKLGMTIGGALVPALSQQFQGFNKSAEAAAYADSKMHGQYANLGSYIAEYNKYYDAGMKIAEQSRAGAAAADKESAALKAKADAMRLVEEESKRLYDADLAGINAALAKEHADVRVKEAQKALADETLKDTEFTDKHRAAYDRIAVAQANYTNAVKVHGAASAQAMAAQDALNTATDAGKNVDQQYADAATVLAADQLNLKEAMLRDAEATVAAAEKTAELGGSSLTAGQKADIMRGALQDLMATLEPGSPLIAALQAYLDRLANIPADKTTTLHLNYIASTPPPGLPGGVAAAEGGVFTRPTLTWVGEAGPEAVIPLRQGNTMPGASPLESLKRPGGTEGGGHTFNFYGVTDAAVIASQVLARLRDYDTLHA